MIRGITTTNENEWQQAYSTLKQRRVEGRFNLVFDLSPDVSLTREPRAASPTVAPFGGSTHKRLEPGLVLPSPAAKGERRGKYFIAVAVVWTFMPRQSSPV